jgi:hypothetical protein
LEDDQYEEYATTPLTSPLEPPMSGAPNTLNIFDVKFGTAVPAEESRQIPMTVPPSAKIDNRHSANSSRDLNLNVHPAIDTVPRNSLVPAGHVVEYSSDAFLFKPAGCDSHRQRNDAFPGWPVSGNPTSVAVDQSISSEPMMFPKLEPLSTQFQHQHEEIPTSSTVRTGGLPQKGFRSSQPIYRSPSLRTTTTVQGLHRPVSDQSVENTGPIGSRVAHNIVEKQYRTRLNHHFGSLLDSIPTDLIGSTINSVRRPDGSERKVSKSEVLILAKRRIETLEKEKEESEHENKRLRGTVDKLEEDWRRLLDQN